MIGRELFIFNFIFVSMIVFLLIANPKWHALFRLSQVHHLYPLSSDHIPILLHVRCNSLFSPRRLRQFRFEEAWLQREDCARVIAASWAKNVLGTPSYRVCEKIMATRVELLKWKHSLHAVQQEIKMVRDQMQVLFTHSTDGLE